MASKHDDPPREIIEAGAFWWRFLRGEIKVPTFTEQLPPEDQNPATPAGKAAAKNRRSRRA